MEADRMNISLGPIQYYWPRATVLAFYEALADSPVDIVYLGEAVCARRHELRLPDWLAVADMLQQAGKQVVLSPQVLIESSSDLGAMRRVAANGRFLVEANDMGAVNCMHGQPFVAGAHLNLYSPESLGIVARLGATRWVMPLEMSRSGLAALLAGRPAQLQTEVFVYGRLPLAFSARCFTARQRNLPKDDCRFSCIAHPDGLLMQTREQQPFLVLNGIQTQSALVYNLVGEVDAMRAMGVDVVRLSPQSTNMPAILALVRAAVDGAISPAEAAARMAPLMPAEACDGFWHGRPGLERCAA